MAIYHLTVKVVSRARGQSIVASAAYRSGRALRDVRYGVTHNYARNRGSAHSEIMVCEGAPGWAYRREELWNRVEAAELRKDSQLARLVELGLPIELSHTESVALMRDYVGEFVSKGMIADFGICRDDPNNPHAHILLTLREVTHLGFGPKVRRWNAKSNLLAWRAAWAERANQHLARAGHLVRIDHRTLEAQHIELKPARRIGIGRERQNEKTLPGYLAERVAEQHSIARDNGETILSDPTVVLSALTHQCPTFTLHDLTRFLQTRTDAAQFEAAYLEITRSSEFVALGSDEGNAARFTSRDLLEAENSLKKRSASMALRKGHGVTSHRQGSVLAHCSLSEEEREAFDRVLSEGDVKILGVAGRGEGTLLAAARQAWEAEGLTVKGTALSGGAAESLEKASGISSRPLAGYELAWSEGRDPLTRDDVLVVDSEMMGIKRLERLLAVADKARAKVVLLGEPQQLGQAVTAPLSTPGTSDSDAAGPRVRGGRP